MKTRIHLCKSDFRYRCIFLCVLSLLFFFSNAKAQSVSRVSISVKNVSLPELLKEIEKNSEVKFSYIDKDIDTTKDISITVNDETVENILTKVLSVKGLEFAKTGNTIAIKKKPQVASTQTISGIVNDPKGEPIIGATVRVKETKIGTMTDIDGRFKLEVASDAVLSVSFIGYEVMETNIRGRANLQITLKEDEMLLDEVVVVGYGTMAKSDLTGSVGSFKAENVTEKGYSSMEQMLQGQMAGVQITQNSGATASGMTFNVRGATSLSGSSQPLIVLDGYPINSDDSQTRMSAGSQSGYLSTMTDDNALAGINPSDIESIEVLKDASATAIYGSRGANGVVLITTKRGKAGTNKIEYSFRSDMSFVPKEIEVLSTAEYIQYINEATLNETGRLHSSYNTQAKIDAFTASNTNWQDLIFRTGFSQNHQISMMGGDDKMRYALTASYYRQEGIIENSQFERGSFRFNFDRDFSKRFTFGMNASGSLTKNDAAQSASDRGEPAMSVIIGALKIRPTLKPYTDDELVDQTIFGNPYSLIYLLEDINKSTNVLVNMQGVYTFMPGFTAKVRGGMEKAYSHRDVYHPRGTTLGNVSGGYAYSGDSERQNYSVETTLNLTQTFAKVHKVNAALGYEYQKWEARMQGMNALGFPSDKTLYYDFSTASSFPAPSTNRNESALQSYLFRAHYTYDQRYLLTFTGRYDESTRLAVGHKGQFFKAAALGWNAHNEEFMKSFEALSQLKMRLSYGESGNQSIAIGATQWTLGSNGAVVAQQVVTGYASNNMPDETLGWETTEQINAGFDLAFFKNRVRFTFDFYQKDTKDLLINFTLPPSTGYGNYKTNAGEIRNIGYEYTLDIAALTQKLKWDISANFSINRNKVLDLGPVDQINASFNAIASQTTNIARVGEPLGIFYGYRIVGIYQTQEEIDAEGRLDAASNAPGLFRYKDIYKDNKIDEKDREIIGNPYPDFTFGLNNSFSWKGISMSFLIQGSIGQDVINANRYFLDGLETAGEYNVSKEAWDNRWTGPGTSNTYPKATMPATTGGGFDDRFTDFIVEDASFVRLKTITAAYTFPKNLIPFVSSTKIFATATNLFTITNYKGFDPEVNSRAGKGLNPGIDNGSIPQYKTFSCGLNINF